MCQCVFAHNVRPEGETSYHVFIHKHPNKHCGVVSCMTRAQTKMSLRLQRKLYKHTVLEILFHTQSGTKLTFFPTPKHRFMIRDHHHIS